MAKLSLVYGISLAAHGVLAASVFGLKEPKRMETIAISMSETKKKEKPAEPAKVVEQPKPIESDAPRPAAKAKVAPAAPKAEAPPPDAPARAAAKAFDPLPDFGLSMGNGPGGMAVPQGGPAVAAVAPGPAATAAPRVLAAKPVEPECSDPLVKPKPRGIAQPAYTSAAREANVEGRVRIEVSVDATGKVQSARLLAGLGYGLDEASLEAARRATFEPGTRCGKPVGATFVIAMRFSL